MRRGPDQASIDPNAAAARPRSQRVVDAGAREAPRNMPGKLCRASNSRAIVNGGNWRAWRCVCVAACVWCGRPSFAGHQPRFNLTTCSLVGCDGCLPPIHGARMALKRATWAQDPANCSL